MKIKRYSLREEVNSNDLAKLNFKCGSWQSKYENKSVMSKCIPLIGEIELHITIPLEEAFDNFEDILVLDNDFCQPYIPFYNDNYGGEVIGFDYLEKVIVKYNEKMNALGIFNVV